jgi:hypothetical protein
MVLANFLGMRQLFAPKGGPTTAILTYNDPSNVLSRSAGSFIAQGYQVGMYLDSIGTALNDGRRKILVVNALDMTLEPTPALVDEAVSSTVLAYFRDVDGLETWPIDKVRASGFANTITGIDSATTEFPVTVSCDGGADDSLELNDVYLSQRTDYGPSRYFSLTRVAGKSGSWSLALTAKAVSDLGIDGATAPLNADQLSRVLRYCTMYFRRQGDGAIQLLDLHTAVFGYA